MLKVYTEALSFLLNFGFWINTILTAASGFCYKNYCISKTGAITPLRLYLFPAGESLLEL